MTALLGFDDGKTIWLAVDRRSSSGDLYWDTTSKILEIGSWSVALCGSDSLSLLVQTRVAGTVYATVHDLTNAMRALFVERGIPHYDKQGTDLQWDFGGLIASPEGLWCLHSDCSARHIPTSRWETHGASFELLAGITAALQDLNLIPGDIIARALRIGASHHVRMSATFELVTIEKASAKEEAS